MVKNSGQKNRTKRYAAEHGITYQQARRTLDARHEQDQVDVLLAECGELPNALPDRIPLGSGTDEVMRWSPFPLPLTEIVGGSQSGKTTTINRIIAYLATAYQDPNCIILLAGDREIEAAQSRWEQWPQVAVYGRTEVLDLLLADSPAAVVFDDWFTEKDGTLLRRMDEQSAQQRGQALDILRGFVEDDDTSVIAAFRPGHVSQRNESEDVEGLLEEVGTFLPADDFALGLWDLPPKSAIEHAIVSPQDEAGRSWAHTRHFRARNHSPMEAPDARESLRESLLGDPLSEDPLGDLYEDFEGVAERMKAEYQALAVAEKGAS